MPELKPSRREGEAGVMLALLNQQEITLAANAVSYYAGIQPEVSASPKARDLPRALGRASMSGKDETVLIFEPAKDWERQAVLREALRSYRDQLDEIVFNCVMDDNPDVNGVRDDALQNAMLASGLLSALSAQPTQEQAS